MMTFDQIAVALLHVYGYEPLLCESDQEAIDKSEDLWNGSKNYPVHFSASNTSGEKGYEEFFTDTESIDMERLQSLGIITNKEVPASEAIDVLFNKLNAAFDTEDVSKEKIVGIIKEYLPNFDHIETGKSLDSKM